MAQESMRTALQRQGLTNLAAVLHNQPTSSLYEEVVRRYDKQARRLAELFRENFRQLEGEVSPAITSAGPVHARGGAS